MDVQSIFLDDRSGPDTMHYFGFRDEFPSRLNQDPKYR
jgi:hypothetical protein